MSKTLFAQNDIEFQRLSGDNVSTQSITYDIDQDSIGNIWIATEEGVLKHNSKFYKIYNTYDGLPDSVSNRATELFIDSKNHVWIGLENGVCLYDEQLDKFNLIGGHSDINPSLVNKIIEDKKGNIWIAAYNGLWKYNPNSADKKMTRVVNDLIVQVLYFINDDTLLLGTYNGLFSYNVTNDVVEEIETTLEANNTITIDKVNNDILLGTKAGRIFKMNPSDYSLKSIPFQNQRNFPITDISNDGIGTNIYIATDGDGLFYVDKNFSVISHFVEDVDSETSISSNGVYDIEIGKEGILWVATYGGGVNYINSKRLPFVKVQHQINDSNSIVTNFTRAIAIDKNDNLWFGTKRGISIWNTKKDTWKHIKAFNDASENAKDIVLALVADGENMWIGTYNNGLFKMNINNYHITHYNSKATNSIKLKKIYTICKDSKKNLWLGGIEGDVTVIRPSGHIDTYPIQPIKSILESNSGTLFAVGRNGVYEIDDQNKTFNLIENLEPNKNTLAYSNINAIHETSDNNLVLATNGAGLIFYNIKSKEIKTLSVSSGMPSDIIQGIVVKNNNDLWASTTKGLTHITTTLNDTIINVYDKKDGLACTEFNYGSFAKLKDSLYAFGGVDGVTLFNPNEIQDLDYEPAIVFDEFRLFNKPLKPGSKILEKHINVTKNIVLENKENSIEIRFTGISYGSPSKIRYSWKLDGFDSDWSVPSQNNFATYTNLNSGDYTFRVKALNKYGNFGTERTINFKIMSPWWATNKAFFMYALIVLGVIMLIIHFTSVIVNKRNADEQIDFFNNITHEIKTPLTILLSSLDNVTENTTSNNDSKKRIKTTVKRINSLFEQMLNFHKVAISGTISQDIMPIDLSKHLKQIVSDFEPLTKERFLNIKIHNNWRDSFFYYDKDVFDKIVLNLISNAIKYSFDNGEININTSKTRFGELKFEITDTGLGIPKDQQKFILKRYYRARNVINSQRPGTGLGLVMVQKLIEKTGGSISFISEENKGTTFTILLKNLKRHYKELALPEQQVPLRIIDEDEDLSELDKFSDNKILIVEDNDELRAILVNTLGVYFQIFEAKNGKEGLEAVSQIFPDLILTDLIMPEMDGMEMSKKIKEDISLNHIPIFMLTVLQNSGQKLESIESGISEYIEKPVDIKFLLAKITNTFNWQQKLREKYLNESDSDHATLFRNKSDQDFLLNLEETVIENIENNTFSVHDLSKSFGMSRTSLYMKLKNLVDLSPQDFIIHTKLKFSKKLLIEGQKSIKEVAYCSGFSNPKYFSTSFKKFYGMTPSGFLESLQKK